jgi:hypothetical protein
LALWAGSGSGDVIGIPAVGALGDGDAVGVAPLVAVVEGAAHDEPIDVGGLAVFPAVDVVDLTAGRGDFAAVDHTGAIAGLQDAVLGGGGAADASPKVERLAVGAEDEGGEPGVEQDRACSFHRDRRSVGEPSGEACAVEGPAGGRCPWHPSHGRAELGPRRSLRHSVLPPLVGSGRVGGALLFGRGVAA